MRRLGFAVLFALGFLLAGAMSAAVVAETISTSTTTTTSTTPTDTTGTTATTPEQQLPAGVRIAGVDVGGQTPDAAAELVRQTFAKPLDLRVAGRRLAPTPDELGAFAYVRGAVERARLARPGTTVQLVVTVKGTAVRTYVAGLSKRFDRKPVDSSLRLRRLQPFLTKDVAGRRVVPGAAVDQIVTALRENDRGPVALKLKTLPPRVTRKSYGPVIVIRRGSNRLFLYRGAKPWRTFGVATGQRVYPTPLGRFAIVVKWRNPWWYPPSSDWAKGLDPVPPGPGNPLGTRWMGLSAPGVGIHGTPDPASIGYSASHGCIRMLIPQAEWLFDHVGVGTPVFVVAA